MNENNQNSRLTKLGVAILVVTICLSVLFITLGIISLAKGGPDYSGSENYYISGTYWVNIGEMEDKYMSYDCYYEVKFTTNSSGDYSIKLNGARIVSFSDDYGSRVSYYSESDRDYDNAYSAYLYSYTTYVVTVCATSYNANVYVDYYNNGTSNDSEDISGTYLASIGSSYYFDANYGSYYEIKLTVSSGYQYDLKFNGADIVSVTDSYGNSISYYPDSDWNYENAYYIYADSYDTYTIKICADSTYVDYYVDYD